MKILKGILKSLRKFETQIPQKSSGALRAPDCFISYDFSAFDPKYPKDFPARFAGRIALFSYDFTAFEPKYPKKFRRVSRAGLHHFTMVYCSLWNPNTLENPARFARRNALFPIVLQLFGPAWLAGSPGSECLLWKIKGGRGPGQKP